MLQNWIPKKRRARPPERLSGLSGWVANRIPSPIKWQPLETELGSVREYLRGRVLNAGCGTRDISPFLKEGGAAEIEQCDQAEKRAPGAFQ
jgi:hypothetical protein